MPDKKDLAIATRAAKAHVEKTAGIRALSLPIDTSVNFAMENGARLAEEYQSRRPTVYSRFGHPTTAAVAAKIADLEGAEAGLLFSSGMAAISTALVALTKGSGAHVVAQREIFAQTFTFLDSTLRGFGVETTFLRADRFDDLESMLRPETKLVYIESPSNPLLRVVDIRRICAVASAHGIPVLIDGTFASPVLQNPIALGASVVLHSGTKYLNGHSDVMCGVAVGSEPLLRTIYEMQILSGGILDSHAAWLLARGMKTLGVRVERQSANALAIAVELSRDARVEAVHYPMLPGTESHAIASRQMKGGGGVVSFELRGGIDAARRFVDALQLIPIATSLGGVETIVEIPSELDFGEHDLGDAASETDIPQGLIRLAVGIEDLDDLLGDIRQALASCSDALEPLARREEAASR